MADIFDSELMAELEKDGKVESTPKVDYQAELEKARKQTEEANKALATSKATWEAEKKALEENVKSLTPQLEVAKQFETLLETNPIEAIHRIAEFHKKKSAPAKEEAASADVEALRSKLNSLEEKLSNQEVEDRKREMREALSFGMEALKEKYGLESDPKEILKFMQEKKLYEPEQVDVAIKALYVEPIAEKAKTVKAEPATVLGGEGFTAEPLSQKESDEKAIKADEADFWAQMADQLK